MVENLPSNAGDSGSISGLETRSHIVTTEPGPQLEKLITATKMASAETETDGGQINKY